MSILGQKTAFRRRMLTLFFLSVGLVGLVGGGLRIALEGPGVLGVNNAVPWGWDVVQFVFWIGLGHAGTLISAVLLLTRQGWSRDIARQAELMTLCAVAVAAVFPAVHVGRVWMEWMFYPGPLPGGLWPNAASPLVWDPVAIGAYFLLSVLYAAMGLREGQGMPPAQRDSRARACLLMAGVLTPLVVTVHSVVGCDFAVLLRWHASFLPPYFVCGAILSGLAMVQLIVRGTGGEVPVPLMRLTAGVATGMGVFYALELAECPQLFDAVYVAMVLLNVAAPLCLLLPVVQHRVALQVLIGAGVLSGMWLERVHIIVMRSEKLFGVDYMPTRMDWAMLVGSIGAFLGLFLLLDARLPERGADGGDATSASPGQGLAACLGGLVGVLVAVFWLHATQGAETAGVLTGRPHGVFFQVPVYMVCGLLGAGVAIYMNLMRRLWS
ncbi:MAG: polysulfide reductase NrfD [Akkermansia muciniphila]|nr:polysulfide reductase NrfD [Akkermansia muciniphila]